MGRPCGDGAPPPTPCPSRSPGGATVVLHFQKSPHPFQATMKHVLNHPPRILTGGTAPVRRILLIGELEDLVALRSGRQRPSLIALSRAGASPAAEGTRNESRSCNARRRRGTRHPNRAASGVSYIQKALHLHRCVTVSGHDSSHKNGARDAEERRAATRRPG